MSNKCPKCTSIFTEKTKFCKICGCNLQEELLEKPTCPKCNTVFSSDIKFCIQDGTKLVHPDKLVPKCVICNKSYNNGAKFCPNDGGQIKLDDEILRLSNTNKIKIEEPISRNEELNTTLNNPQVNYNLPKKYNKAPLGKRALAYFLDSLIISALFLPSLYLLYDSYLGIINNYYVGYNDYFRGKVLLGFLLILVPIRYSLIKDGIAEGQSYGKSAVDLMVINVNTNKPCTKLNSAGRNILLIIIWCIPYIGALTEVILIFANPDGRKLSDFGAGTQVIAKGDFKK